MAVLLVDDGKARNFLRAGGHPKPLGKGRAEHGRINNFEQRRVLEPDPLPHAPVDGDIGGHHAGVGDAR